MTDTAVASRRPGRGKLSIAGWFERARARAALRNLGDDVLKDCGLSRADVEREIRRLRW